MPVWNLELTLAKKKRRSASSVMALIADDAEPPPLPEKVQPKKAQKRKATCDVCGKRNQPIACTDGDEHWEVPGHPDHIDREICVECIDDYRAREGCSLLVYDAMRRQLREKEFTDAEIEQAVHIAWRTFEVAFDHKQLVKMARKLKVKHSWIKGKRTK